MRNRALLIVEDTPSLARTYEAHLKSEFDDIRIVDTGEAALQVVAQNAPTCILLDLKLPDYDGSDLLKRWVAEGIDTAIVVITANGSMSVAVEAMRNGAADFVVKPTSKEKLREIVRNALKSERVVRENPRAPALSAQKTESAAPASGKDFCDFVGQSLPMKVVYRTIESAAPSRAHVFVTGETGTGKELVARAVHSTSPRKHKSFVALNCGAIPTELIESELFGHVKGAFTGATADRIGAIQRADGGTLFLDELGEMPINLQPKLLRFIQTGEFSRVGESTERRADLRIVAATNRNPLEAVREGLLREDLYYRLHVIPISLPPLRERSSDILLLAQAFLDKYAREEGRKFEGFDRSAQAWLVDQSWPGNVRQLENFIRQIAVLHQDPVITAQSLAQFSANTASASLPMPRAQIPAAPTPWHPTSAQPVEGAEIEPLWLTEKKAIERAIALCDGNITAAAKMLELSPSTIYRKREGWVTAKSA